MINYQHKKGVIRENALKAILKDPIFKQRVERNLKGKGSYRRYNKHRNNEAAYAIQLGNCIAYAA